jgi:ankyrin repeat protein
VHEGRTESWYCNEAGLLAEATVSLVVGCGGVAVAWGLTGGFGCAGSSAMPNIWDAAEAGVLGEVERLVGQDPGLLDAKNEFGQTPLMHASGGGHVGVVRWLLDKGAAINAGDESGSTALMFACSGGGHTPVVRLLLERGADPTIADEWGWTSLMAAAREGHLEVVRLLLGHPIVKASINDRNEDGDTALWLACYEGRGGIVRALLQSGADPTIANNDGTTPMAIAKKTPPPAGVSALGRRECVAALEVRSCLPLPPSLSTLL